MANNRKRRVLRLMKGHAITMLERFWHKEHVNIAGGSVPNYGDAEADRDSETLSSYAEILERLYGEHWMNKRKPDWADYTMDFLN